MDIQTSVEIAGHRLPVVIERVDGSYQATSPVLDGFQERYAGAVESTIYRDFQDFGKAVGDPSFEPQALAEARVNIVENPNYSLRNVSRVNATYRGIMCLIAMRGAKDFQADDSIEFHALEDHHIFPQAYLKKLRAATGEKIAPGRINSIVNRTLISAQTNRRISRRSPSNYLAQLVPAGRAQEIMASHFIDDDGLAAMQADNFDAFLDARELSLLTEVIARVSD